MHFSRLVKLSFILGSFPLIVVGIGGFNGVNEKVIAQIRTLTREHKFEYSRSNFPATLFDYQLPSGRIKTE